MREAKNTLRARLRGSRAAVPAPLWAAADLARTRALLGALSDLPSDAPVAAYASLPGEPSTTAAIDALHRSGHPVLLPVLRRDIAWAWFEGWEHTAPAWRGIPQPTGTALGAEALGLASAIVAPCLAVGLDGTRLGTGGGWYDRALPHRQPSAVVIALARDAEVYPTLPVEAHDLRVDAVATESGVTWFTTPPRAPRSEFA
ncbi:MAG TPA: 5-formyltetrahydrofolate cyclo-ligase [Arachnia sp.]|nr:5-formyltetrahydrofolate cyclo-ligase [Arachnia sp.]HMT87605.1 5-formyltetrahydrofolate cyclo-ligase [Arachnia sp.]